MTENLASWNDGPTKSAIVAFVDKVVAADVPVEERVAVFDADGTLWCEQPVPAEAGFILAKLAEMAEASPERRTRQPWKAAYEHDNAWLGKVITDHYAGDDAGAKLLLSGIGTAFADMDVENFQTQSGTFLRDTMHPTLHQPLVGLTYAPMLELLRHLEANGFSTWIVSGSGSDFMRPVAQEAFGIPTERVIASLSPIEYTAADGGRITRKAQFGFLDDGPQKPVQIWNGVGRRPLLAVGNSNGDTMLEFEPHPGRPSLRLLVNHDDAAREFAYGSGAERALAAASENGWTVVSMKNDFARVF
ncbi:HAD family hydrolase [Humibacillus xanthopallidus]|uniref:Haloacid dehalogenase-like hydrolase n=1 Tax=Humibacillus xanthopallidus TaxID=412689 RepID=A0A543HWY5_9MICO|nr:HAD family hydrolase [Humibacillus xanthopallidus]TQM62868.1 haloacid dehalogenase-like hydrolase [Humibacillus xanthopallidus]